jgi:predicted DNA-binding transcriptional regulator YafY
MNALSETILRLQGNGDYDGVVAFMERYGTIGADLQRDLDRLAARGIPVDVVFEQGMSILR